MKDIFKVGDRKEFKRRVSPEDIASFQGEVVHPVCATFSLARDIEWTTRQFVLEMRDADEEGIGTFLSIDHRGPAFVGEEIIFTGYVDQINGHELICSFEARVGERLIAIGKTGQKILKRSKIDKLLAKP
ncbi:MAG: thioesterase family protein [Bacteroidota bacterium]